MKKKGFTLIELLVVISIIALLMAILMPALNRVRQMAYRMVCGTNLSGIGRAIMIYSNDNDEEYPRAGGRKSRWGDQGTINDWTSMSEATAFGGGRASDATITSSFYLLVRFADVTPKQFVCKGDGANIFKLSDAMNLDEDVDDLTDVWDFGDPDMSGTMYPGQYCSYSMHMPYDIVSYRGSPIGTISNPASPLCADRNPYLDDNARSYLDGKLGSGDPDENAAFWGPEDADEGEKHYYDQHKTGNSAAHLREGQNVLFADAHVTFERYPNCGIENDNIWKHWDESWEPGEDLPEPREMQVGSPGESWSEPPTGVGGEAQGHLPRSEKDAYLVNEYNGDPTELPIY